MRMGARRDNNPMRRQANGWGRGDENAVQDVMSRIGSPALEPSDDDLTDLAREPSTS